MTDGRTLWRAKDCEWSLRERVVALGEEFGPAGPMLLDWLEEQAKKQRGQILTGYRAAARGAFLLAGAEEAERIIGFAVEVGALDDFEALDGGRFRCRVSGFSEDQRHGNSASRQARARGVTERDVSGPSVTKRDKALRGVTERCKPSHTEQDRREEETTAMSSSGELDDARIARELFDYWQISCGHETSKPTRERLGKVRARLREGYSQQQIRQAIDGAARAAFVNDAGKRFDDLELICRSGSKLEGFITRGDQATPSESIDDFTARYGAAQQGPVTR